jgi:tetratricopeptide (TPR) repeat protein
MVLAHARVVGDAGEPESGFVLLCRACAALGDTAALRWTAGWTLPPSVLVRGASALYRELEAEEGTPACAAAWGPAAALLEARAAVLPNEVALQWMTAVALRRAGRLEDALKAAGALYARHPSYQTAVGAANAGRAAGRFDVAEAMWRAALQASPEDVPVRLDWADELFARGERARARAGYGEVLAREPTHPWARASMLWLDLLDGGGAPAWWALRELARSEPDNARAGQALAASTPGVGALPVPSEASLNGLARVLASGREARRIEASDLECASAIALLHRQAEAAGMAIQYTARRVPSPDPRRPIGRPRWVAFRWSGLRPTPAVPPPPGEVVDALREVAGTPFERARWGEQGAAATLGAPSLELFAVAVHAAAVAEPTPAAVSRLQVAAALALAFRADWADTPHRAALWSLAATRADWVQVAAAIGASARAAADPAVRDDARALLWSMLGRSVDGAPAGPVDAVVCPDGGAWWPGEVVPFLLAALEDPVPHRDAVDGWLRRALVV